MTVERRPPGSPLDFHLARTLTELAGEGDERVHAAITLLSAAVRSGHVCLDLHRLPAQVSSFEANSVELPPWGAGECIAALKKSRLVSLGGGDAPLVLDTAGRLYFRRYWEYEQQVARALRERARWADPEPLSPALRQLARGLFAANTSASGEWDWQQLAALVALHRRLCVVTGGPGTGKTFSVANVLALLFAHARERGERWPRVELVAPTGKAAQRLSESLQANKETIRRLAEQRELPLVADVLGAIPTEAKTIHRCLGTVGESSVRFYHDADNPLAADIVIVDESSMIDLSLMAHLLAALPGHARLVLLGDEHQLASVEAGSVLGDVCNLGADSTFSVAQWRWLQQQLDVSYDWPRHAPADSGLWDCIVRLRRNFRYDADSGIGRLAEAIRWGDPDAAWRALESGDQTVESAAPLPPWRLSGALAESCRRHFARYVQSPSGAERLREFGAFRVLCGNRTGPNGVLFANRAIERELEDARVLRNTSERWYDGRPVLVTENNYWVRLFNGDLGIVMARDGRAPIVAFPGAEPGSVREFSPGRLPEHETAFAMTIHKSQGSEFDRVEVVLPQRGSPLLSRELLYTAVTRAKRWVRVHADRATFEQAVRQRVERSSGLRDALWGGSSS
ncbi:MAG: RecBCD enzyme subunit RecD [Candidatus Binatia bacterium]|nr:MAG: RecBCD enzyme subunit RecD [Candidatus Binatia bacterium]